MRQLLRRAARTLSSKPRLAALRQELKRDAAPKPLPDAPSDARSFFVETRGCQMNVSDSEVVRTLLCEDGLREAESAATADVVLLNTCAIRDKAEQKVWTRLRDLRGRKGVKGQTVAVLGCMAERVKDDLFRDGLADVVVGPDAYRRLPAMLRDQTQAIDVKLDRSENYADLIPTRLEQTAHGAFVSIQRGCDNACSYCIVPYVRGRERSRSVQTIVDEVSALYNGGVREITLLGQNVNSYHDASTESLKQQTREYTTDFTPFVKNNKKDAQTGVRFAELLERCAAAAPDARLRFTSPHPKDFPDDVLATIARVSNIAKQIHMPAQSGSDQMLRRMRRGYTNDAYRALIERARAVIPDVALSSDFIAGFCGESHEDHLRTLRLIQDVGYDMAFLFAYSSRERTPAARRLEDDVPSHEKKRRLQELIDAFRVGREARSRERVGRIHLVLVEGAPRRDRGEGLVSGRDDGNRVHVFPSMLPDGTALMPGDFAHVLADRAEGATLIGVALRRAAGAGDRPLVDAETGAEFLIDEQQVLRAGPPRRHVN
jgi:MiaB/RimO family radical SAM methylthiotransferase